MFEVGKEYNRKDIGGIYTFLNGNDGSDAGWFKGNTGTVCYLTYSCFDPTPIDDTPPDPTPGIASVMFGSKPRLMYGSLMQIQGPTKDEEARNARTEEERKRYYEN